MFTVAYCSNGHEEIHYDSRYGERKCPLCDAIEKTAVAEDELDRLQKQIDYISKTQNENPHLSNNNSPTPTP